MPALIYHIPKAITNLAMPVPFGPDYNTVLHFANILARERYGVPTALMLSVAQREALLEDVEVLLRHQDDLAPRRAS